MPLSGNDKKIHKPLRLNPEKEPRRPNDPRSNPETEIKPPRLNHPQAQEYGCHLRAQHPGPSLNLNSNPETEFLLHKSCLCLGMTKKSISLA